MPYYSRKPKSQTDARHTVLVKALVGELKKGPTTGPGGGVAVQNAPVIIEEAMSPGQSVHVYVIWDEWASVTEEHRSAAILDAYDEAKGKTAMMNISIAMGLTPTEADRLGIKP